MKSRTNGGLRNLACAATLVLGAANANGLDNYVDNNKSNFGKEETSKILDYAKDTLSFGGGLLSGLLSHEVAHKLVGDALGMDASYNPLKDPVTTYYTPGSKLENALFSGAGLTLQNSVSAAIVNSKIDLKENPFAVGYLAFAVGNNLKYALFPNDRGETSDSLAISEATGISQKVISGVLIASSLYLGKKVLDNFKRNDASDLTSNFSPHLGIDGSLGIQYKVKDSPWSISAGVNLKEKSAGVTFGVSLDGKRN